MVQYLVPGSSTGGTFMMIHVPRYDTRNTEATARNKVPGMVLVTVVNATRERPDGRGRATTIDTESGPGADRATTRSQASGGLQVDTRHQPGTEPKVREATTVLGSEQVCEQAGPRSGTSSANIRGCGW